jgi:hypothetical protein
VVRDVPVQDVRPGGTGLSSAGTEGVVVRVAPELAERIISALDMDGAVIRGGIVSGSDLETALPDLASCVASS